jgi:cysteine desulfurase family protein (TIGR01976 family)
MALDLTLIRSQFPALSLPHGDGARVYLDNPAGTQVPTQVLDRMHQALVDCNANMGGKFRTSREATALSAEAHEAMADMYHAASPSEIVFGANMTTLTFVMARLLGPLFDEGDEMITTEMEHDGNQTPWLTMAAERGMVVKTLPWDRDTYELDLDALDALITPRTKFAAINYASNILGTINPVKEIVGRLRSVGAITFLDAVQYAPHGVIDVQDLGCDFLVSSPYKWYGPHQGVLYGRAEMLDRLRAYKLRVVPDIAPNKFETGTQSLAGQAGVLGAVEYLQWLGTTMAGERVSALTRVGERTAQVHAALQAMVDYEETLSERLISGLQAIPGVVVHGITDPAAFSRRVPTVSWSHPGVEPAAIASYLDEHGVYVWNGHNYGLTVIECLGLQDRGGVVRVGPTHYNTVEEVDEVVRLTAEYVGTHARS